MSAVAGRLKLYALYIGGEVPGANIEVHDVRFVVAPSLSATFPTLRRDWWGTPQSLHLDCWVHLTQVDDYDVRIASEPFAGSERLFFVNLGGYLPGQFMELHRNLFAVAETAAEAKTRALSTVADWSERHRDELYDVDEVIAVSAAIGGADAHVHLARATKSRPLDVRLGYRPLGKSLG